VERFYRGSTGEAHDRVKLFKLIGMRSAASSAAGTSSTR
jgi:hypothetical protein